MEGFPSWGSVCENVYDKKIADSLCRVVEEGASPGTSPKPTSILRRPFFSSTGVTIGSGGEVRELMEVVRPPEHPIGPLGEGPEH